MLRHSEEAHPRPILWLPLRVSMIFALAFALLIAFSGITSAKDNEVVGDDGDRRDATLTYYAFHIAKLDASVSFCNGARTEYRLGFEQIVAASGTAIHDQVMKSFDDRYETFFASLGGYACPENEISHYRNRLAKQIINLKRDLALLK